MLLKSLFFVSIQLVIATLLTNVKLSNGFQAVQSRSVDENSMAGMFSASTGNVDDALWFDNQQLDHFDPSNRATWKQRYFLKMGVFDSSTDAPILLLLGGENAVNPYNYFFGQMTDYASHFKAAILILEHRYYGYSRPTRLAINYFIFCKIL